MTATIIPLPRALEAPLRRATTHTCDADGNWFTEPRELWKDATGWHDRPIPNTQPKDAS